MQHVKTVEVPATTKEVVERTTCDLCGTEIKKGRMRADEVTVEARDGTAFPEGGSGTEVTFDICRFCFNNVLVPFLTSRGAQPRKTEWSW